MLGRAELIGARKLENAQVELVRTEFAARVKELEAKQQRLKKENDDLSEAKVAAVLKEGRARKRLAELEAQLQLQPWLAGLPA